MKGRSYLLLVIGLIVLVFLLITFTSAGQYFAFWK